MLSIILTGQVLAFGVVLISMGWITSTWIQQRTPKDMLGRMMSMTVLASMGLAPLSQALAGAISRWNLTLMFALAGALLLVMTLRTALHPALKALSHEIVTSGAE